MGQEDARTPTAGDKEAAVRRVDADGVGIEIDAAGRGRRSCCGTASPDSGRLWRHQAPALTAAGFRVIVPDLRDYGRSDQPEDVAALVQARPGPRRIALGTGQTGADPAPVLPRDGHGGALPPPQPPQPLLPLLPH